MRALILEADPEVTEEVKWRGTPVWSHHGIICTGEAYAKVVKLTFAKGAKIPDPAYLFNSSLEGNTRRAIDIHEGEVVEAGAFKALVKAAVAQNVPGKKPKTARSKVKPVKLLSGGNPQIAKADGDAPVQAYIAAMPGWKSDLGKRLDALIVRSSRGKKGSEVELAVLRHRRPGLVPVVPRSHSIREGDLLCRHVAGPIAARRHRAQQGCALD
jgi:hypothetical protein